MFCNSQKSDLVNNFIIKFLKFSEIAISILGVQLLYQKVVWVSPQLALMPLKDISHSRTHEELLISDGFPIYPALVIFS